MSMLALYTQSMDADKDSDENVDTPLDPSPWTFTGWFCAFVIGPRSHKMALAEVKFSQRRYPDACTTWLK